MKYQINNDKSFVRDTNTHAIIRTDNTDIQQYNRKRQEKTQLKQEIADLRSEIENLKKLVDKLVNRNNQCH